MWVWHRHFKDRRSEKFKLVSIPCFYEPRRNLREDLGLNLSQDFSSFNFHLAFVEIFMQYTLSNFFLGVNNLKTNNDER
jgi:hypothetical protein